MNTKIKKIILKKNKQKLFVLQHILKVYQKSIIFVILYSRDSMANVLYGHKNTHKLI